MGIGMLECWIVGILDYWNKSILVYIKYRMDFVLIKFISMI